MKKLLFPLLVLVVLSSCTKKQETVSNIDELLAKHFDAIGADILKNCQTVMHRDRISISPDNNAYTEIEVFAKKPNSYFFKSVDNGDTVVMANNSRNSWIYIQGEYKEREPEKGKNSFNMYAYGFASLLFGKMNNWSMEYTGRESFNGKELYRVKVIQPEMGESGRDSLYIYDIDPDDFLIVRMTNGGATQYYSDYKTEKGVKYASKVSSDFEGVKTEGYFRGTILEFKIDAELPDQLFEPERLGIKK